MLLLRLVRSLLHRCTLCRRRCIRILLLSLRLGLCFRNRAHRYRSIRIRRAHRASLALLSGRSDLRCRSAGSGALRLSHNGSLLLRLLLLLLRSSSRRSLRRRTRLLWLLHGSRSGLRSRDGLALGRSSSRRSGRCILRLSYLRLLTFRQRGVGRLPAYSRAEQFVLLLHLAQLRRRDCPDFLRGHAGVGLQFHLLPRLF